MSQNVKGTFISAQSVNLGQVSDVLVVPTGRTSLRLNLGGTLDASNTVKTQKSTNQGQTWADQTTYNAAQVNTAVAVADGEQWRLAIGAQQALKAIDYSLSAES